MADQFPAPSVERFLRVTSNDEPAEFRGLLAQVKDDVPFHTGTLRQAIQPRFVERASGLAVPASSAETPMDYVSVFLVSSDYLECPPGIDRHQFSSMVEEKLRKSADPDDILTGLGALALAYSNDELTSQVVGFATTHLRDEYQRRLAGVLPQRVPLARQPILQALRATLLWRDELDPIVTPLEIHPLVRAFFLTHAAGERLGQRIDDDTEEVGGFPVGPVLELIRNQVFNETDDRFSVIDRYLRLWNDYGNAAEQYLGGRSALQLFKAATGLSVDDALALGFGLIAFASNWDFTKSPLVPLGYLDDAGSSWKIFQDLMSATPREMTEGLAADTDGWDFLLFEERPLIRMPNGFLITDPQLMFDRVTSGLYWYVHDYLRDSEGPPAQRLWTQAWGEMVEQSIEDSLRHLAVPVLGSGTAFFTEEDLQQAYPGAKNIDVVIDFGTELGGFEIVSGRVSVPTRIAGDRDALMRDMERLVFKKLRQLDETGKTLLRNETPLTGVEQASPRPFRPVLVAGGGLPVSPILSGIIVNYCHEADLLNHPLMKPLAIVDPGEVEMIEALAERGHAIPAMLDEWQSSGIGSMSLRNFLSKKFADHHMFRPQRMRARVDAAFESIKLALGVVAPDAFADP